MNSERLSDKHNVGIKEPKFTVTLFSCFHCTKHQLRTIDVPNSLTTKCSLCFAYKKNYSPGYEFSTLLYRTKLCSFELMFAKFATAKNREKVKPTKT